MDKLKYGFFLLLLSQSLHALTTLSVTKSTDNNPGGMGEVGDLRYYINVMNQDLSTIPDDYAIVFAFPMTITLNGILPIINNSANAVNITIGNSGSIATVTIDGNSGAYSGFFIPMGNVTIQNMTFQNMTAKGGDGGNGISGGGGGLGAGGAIYVPQTFLNGSNPSVTLKNVTINTTSAVGGNGGSYFSIASPTGMEGGAGGGGFSGNGGSVTVAGSTGGGGGGGFGGNGGDVITADGGGGGGGGLGSRANLAPFTNLGNGGSDQDPGQDGNGIGLTFTAGAGAGGHAGGNQAGGGGGGGGAVVNGGGGGGSQGSDGLDPHGSVPALKPESLASLRKSASHTVSMSVTNLMHELKALFPGTQANQPRALAALTLKKPTFGPATPSGGNGGDGAGAGGGGVIVFGVTNNVDGRSGNGGYGGGGGGGSGLGASDTDYTVEGGTGGIGGGGGGGGVNHSGSTSAAGGDSSGGGGGGGGGPSETATALGGSDVGSLGGGSGGAGANTVTSGTGGGGGGGGSGLGGAIFIDSGLNFTIQALSGVATTFNTINTTVQAGTHGLGAPGATDGLDGTALGNSIFLRNNASLTLLAQDTGDTLTLGSQVSFTDDTSLGSAGTIVHVKGNGTVIYQGTTDYQGVIRINNANFKVTGVINNASVYVCRETITSQRGTLSGSGSVTGSVSVNSGTIKPDADQVLSLGSLTLSSAAGSSLGSLVHLDVDAGGTSSVAVSGAASLHGILEVNLDSNAATGNYTLLTSSGLVGTFDSVTVTSSTGKTPNYTLSYLPVGAPTYVQLNFTGLSSVDIPATVNGSSILNPAVISSGRPVILGPLSVPGSGPTTYRVTAQTGDVTCEIGQTSTQTYLKMRGKQGSCTIVGTKDGVTSNPLTVTAS